MRDSQIQKQFGDVGPQQTASRWVGILASEPPEELPGFTCRMVAGEGRSKKLYLRNKLNFAVPLWAEGSGCGVLFDGVLYNHAELQRELGESPARPASNSAELILAAYRRWGKDFFHRLRGTFVLIIWDSQHEVLLGLRDPIGSFPLFYTEHRDGLMLSPSIDILRAQPSAPTALNRAVLAECFLYRNPRNEETFFEGISRIRSGHLLRLARGELSTHRYWDPAPGDTVDWATPEELERFDELLDQAVTRCVGLGSVGIFLSGGLDSVSVAAFAAQRAATDGVEKPLALSLVFPERDINEEIVQRGVASQLGLPQVIKGFFEATGESGLLANAVAMNSLLSAPVLNTWLPAYHGLVREGKQRGCRTILTGQGGDEWLTVSPLLMADMLRQFDLKGVFRLWQTARRSLRRPELALFRFMFWTSGLGPLVIPPLHKVAKRFVPSLVKMRRRVMAPLPKWLAPDPALHRQLQSRWEEKSLAEKRSSKSFYLDEVKTSLDHPVPSWEMEELFNFGQMTGVQVVHPIWDPDLVDLLFRTPPFQLIRNGRSKGLVRDTLARRFPNLGFEYKRKTGGTDFYASCIYREAKDVWKQLGGSRALEDLGVVDRQSIGPDVERLLSKCEIGQVHLAWSVLNLESWARAHTS